MSGFERVNSQPGLSAVPSPAETAYYDERPIFAPRSLDAIIEEIYEVLNNGRSMPFMSSTMVSADLVAKLVQELQETLPQAIQEAQRVLRDADAIRQKAEHDYRVTMDEAKARARQMIDNKEIVRQASLRADEIIGEAQSQIRTKAHEANEFIQKQLTMFDERLNQLHNITVKGLERMRNDPNPFDLRESLLSPQSASSPLGGMAPVVAQEEAFYDADDF